jgi:tRNA(Ile)-lysidine synthase
MRRRLFVSAPRLRKSALAAAEPLTLDELDAAMSAIGGSEPRPLLAVGVSGGPDSLALVILANRWARQRGGVAWALIVDHRLRLDSGVEAAKVVGWLAARGIPHQVLVWDGPKPASGIQEAARTARYRLLVDWCVAQGCLHLLTAHHRDDQMETYLIRRRAKSGVDGLAGMATVRELSGIRLLRPLLELPKAALVAFLATEGQDYVQDPSNRNPAFERSRLRLDAQAWETEGTAAALRKSAALRVAREKKLAALLARAVTLHPAGFASIEPAPIVTGDELGESALGRVATVIGGAVYPVRRARLRRLRTALASDSRRARTLGGCRFVPWRGRVLVFREAARVEPPVKLLPGDSVCWDRRFLATLPSNAIKPFIVGALGTAELMALRRDPVADENSLPRLIYPVLPAMWDEAGLAVVPHLGWRRATNEQIPAFAFRPPVPLFGTGFTVV